MASKISKTLPSLSKCKTYQDQLMLIKIWPKSTNRQGQALVLSIEDEALDAALEIDESDISKENGVDFITDHLNRLFKKVSTVTKYQALEAFVTFKKPANMSKQAYLIELDTRLFIKLKRRYRRLSMIIYYTLNNHWSFLYIG